MLHRSAPLVLPPAKPPVAEWAEKHLRFDPAVDAATSYILAKSPYSRAVFEWWLDPLVEEIFMIYPTQASKTASIVALLTYCLANDPGPIIIVQAKETTTKSFIKKRLRPTIAKTLPQFADAEWSEDAGARIGGSDIWPAWSTSEDRCRQWPRRYVFGDETSIWSNSRQLVWERTKQFQRNRKALWGTTPTVETEQSWIAATEVFQLYRYHVPCPLCGAFQVLDFKRLKFDHCKNADGTWDLEKVERDTRYQCEHCEEEITQDKRPAMLQAGEARTEVPNRSPRRKALRITAADVPNISWGLYARTFLECKANPDDLRVFVNSWMTEPWRPRENGLVAKQVMSRVLEMKQDSVPENTVCLLGAVDVQRGHVWATVRAFMDDERSVLIHCARVDGHKADGTASTAIALENCWNQVLSRQWRWTSQHPSIGVMMTIVDSGDGETAGDVYRWAWNHYGRVVLAKGSSTQAQAWRASSVSRYPDGRPIPGGVKLYHVRSDYYREIIVGSYMAAMEDKGAWLIAPGTPQEYGDHMSAWQIESKKGKDNRLVREWKQIRRNDHWLDCEIYGAALWEIMRFMPKSNPVAERPTAVAPKPFSEFRRERF